MLRRHAIAMHRFAARFCVHSCVACLLTAITIAQRTSVPEPQLLQPPQDPHWSLATTYKTTPGTGVLIFTVYAERKGAHLDRQALLRLVNLSNQSSVWRTTEDASRGVFTDIPYGDYAVEVSAVGYLSNHQELKVTNSTGPSLTDVVLERDPEAVSLDVSDAMMPPKARKQTRRAVSALKSGNLKEAQKQLEEAYRLAPASSDLDFLLGYLYFQKKDFAQAGTYLGSATNLNPHNAQALTLLGRTGLERKDYPAARSALEQAVLADAANWLPHNLLADAYLHQQDYGKARDQAQIAITIGKTGASPAQLVLGQALVNLGQDQAGIQALNVFLQESPQNPTAVQVRTLIAEIQEHTSGPSTSSDTPEGTPGEPAGTQADISAVDPLAALAAPGLFLKSWQPPGVDDVKPAIALNVECPTDKVIEESGKRVQDLVDDVARFSAVEDLLHQSLDQFGIPVRTETRRYNYVASISEPQPGFLAADEYRADKILTLSEFPDNIASTGFAALALIFHPHMRDNFAMTCEGLGDWHGQATWLVHFRQREDRPNRIHSYKIGNQTYPVDLKGRAWITADKFQIVRIESEMINPLPDIRLLSEHEVVEYGAVPFPKRNTSLWLPKNADIYFDFRKHHYYRRHSFDHYMLYSVDTDEKRKEPVAKPADGKKT
jgi:tetratricopeptide (TPR) repeat protein